MVAAAAGVVAPTAAASVLGPAGVATIVAGGPVVWGLAALGATIVGAEEHVECGFTWDCWKALVHEDASSAPSTGRTVSELLNDPRVKGYSIDEQRNVMLLHNMWGEEFELEYVPVPVGVLMPGRLAAHLRPCGSNGFGV